MNTNRAALGALAAIFLAMACQAQDDPAAMNELQDTDRERLSHDYPSDPAQLSEDEWRARLTEEEYRVLRQNGTERAGTGQLTDHEGEGIYRCAACGAELFRSDHKFHSGCGWPSFYDPTESEAVNLIEDRSHGMVRTEVRCATCDSHLGHVFHGEGYDTPTDARYCINSVSLDFATADEEEPVESDGEEPVESDGETRPKN